MVPDELSFVDALRPGGHSQARRSFYDYAISGRPLRQLVEVGDNIGVFGWLERAHEAQFARQLLLRAPSELPSGRVPIYICPECADLGCGCVSVRVVEDHESFAWTDFGFEANFDAAPPTSFLEIRPLYFAKDAYLAAIRRFWPRGGR